MRLAVVYGVPAAALIALAISAIEKISIPPGYVAAVVVAMMVWMLARLVK